MSFAVELYFGPPAEMLVLQVWGWLAEARVSSSMRESGYRPHLSLGISDRLHLGEVVAALEQFARQYAPFPLTFSSLGVFPTPEATVYLGVTVTHFLLNFHAQFQAVFEPCTEGLWEHYRVGAWVPHCTLAFGLPSNRVPEAIAIAQRVTLPIQTQGIALGITEVSPAHSKSLRLFPLGGGAVLSPA